jgi:hypothetical protein
MAPPESNHVAFLMSRQNVQPFETLLSGSFQISGVTVSFTTYELSNGKWLSTPRTLSSNKACAAPTSSNCARFSFSTRAETFPGVGALFAADVAG